MFNHIVRYMEPMDHEPSPGRELRERGLELELGLAKGTTQSSKQAPPSINSSGRADINQDIMGRWRSEARLTPDPPKAVGLEQRCGAMQRI